MATQANDSAEMYFKGIPYQFETLPPRIIVRSNIEHNRRKIIGRGTFAFCFLYESQRGDSCFVAKVTSKQRLPTTAYQQFPTLLSQKWKREVKILRLLLRHENIVRFYKIIKVSGLEVNSKFDFCVLVVAALKYNQFI